MLACTNRDYLGEVLQRIGGKAGKRALPDTLREWASLGNNASFWGLRHYDQAQSEWDPTSPFRDFNIIGIADKQASGITLTFALGERRAKISYFSGARDVIQFLQERTPLCMKVDGVTDSTANLPIVYRQAAPGVVEIEYQLGDAIPIDLFISVVLGAFGHAGYF